MAKVVTTTPLLILLYGYPGAGKTFFARQFCEEVQAAHVQADRIRFELFEQPRYDKPENDVVMQIMNYMTHEFLSAGISVVYDTNAMRAAQRHQLRDMARKLRAQPLLVWFQVDPESALNRAVRRDRRRSDDKYAAPMDRQVFDSVLHHMQNPTTAEDYVVISGKHVFNTQYSAVSKRMHELNMISSEEANAKVVKPGLVNLIPNPAAGRVDMTRRNIIIR
jgi:predicted kinase